MGNLPEPWMYDELDSAAIPPSALDFKRDLPPLSLPLTSRLPWSVRLRLTSWYRDRKSWRFKEGQASAAP